MNSTDQDADSAFDLSVSIELLTRRLNALIAHASNIKGQDAADSNAKEISVHIKNVKDLRAYNEAVKTAKPEGKRKYTPEEKW